MTQAQINEQEIRRWVRDGVQQRGGPDRVVSAKLCIRKIDDYSISVYDADHRITLYWAGAYYDDITTIMSEVEKNIGIFMDELNAQARGRTITLER